MYNLSSAFPRLLLDIASFMLINLCEPNIQTGGKCQTLPRASVSAESKQGGHPVTQAEKDSRYLARVECKL